jgi:hypothetical protein
MTEPSHTEQDEMTIHICSDMDWNDQRHSSSRIPSYSKQLQFPSTTPSGCVAIGRCPKPESKSPKCPNPILENQSTGDLRLISKFGLFHKRDLRLLTPPHLTHREMEGDARYKGLIFPEMTLPPLHVGGQCTRRVFKPSRLVGMWFEEGRGEGSGSCQYLRYR